MSDELNSRPDAKLKRLDIQIIRDMLALYGMPGKTQADAVAWLKKEHGVSSSTSAFSQSLEYLKARVRSADREQRIQVWLETEKLEHPEISDEELFRRGQRKFSLMTIADEDPEAWAKIQKAARDKEQSWRDSIKVRRETIELFIEWAKNEEAVKLATSNSPRPVKMETLGKKMFGDLWD